jgi:hypothetical protein
MMQRVRSTQEFSTVPWRRVIGMAVEQERCAPPNPISGRWTFLDSIGDGRELHLSALTSSMMSANDAAGRAFRRPFRPCRLLLARRVPCAGRDFCSIVCCGMLECRLDRYSPAPGRSCFALAGSSRCTSLLSQQWPLSLTATTRDPIYVRCGCCGAFLYVSCANTWNLLASSLMVVSTRPRR